MQKMEFLMLFVKHGFWNCIYRKLTLSLSIKDKALFAVHRHKGWKGFCKIVKIAMTHGLIHVMANIFYKIKSQISTTRTSLQQ